MGKVCSCLSVAVLVGAGAIIPWRIPATQAQTRTPAGCNSQAIASPMQGHYTGPWHSEADYHFKVHFDQFGAAPPSDWDLEMKIIIDGKLDISVAPNGTASGTATGSVDAPIYHNGVHDISSGIGTISGQVTGVLQGSGVGLVLAHPVIVMQWGTFGGRAVSTSPVMPDYQFPVSSLDCISSQGSIVESGFPTVHITDDSTGQLTQAPGIGVASGTWQLTSDGASQFSSLSQRVTDFIGQAEAFLNDTSSEPTAALWNQKIVQPLKDLQSEIQQNPSVAKCLLERLQSWEGSALLTLTKRIQSLGSSQTISDLRSARTLILAGYVLAKDCGDSTTSWTDTLLSRERDLLDTSVAKRDWASAALLIREVELLQGNNVRQSLQSEINHDLHLLVSSGLSPASALDVGRMAYALGDDTDAAAAVKLVPSSGRSSDGTPPGFTLVKPGKNKKARHHKPVKPKPKLKAKAPPKSLIKVLMSGSTRLHATALGSPPRFSWDAVANASRYVVVVTPKNDPRVLWTWSGLGRSATYGDTGIDGVPETASAGWRVPIGGTGYYWAILALDSQGKIAGLALRVKGS